MAYKLQLTNFQNIAPGNVATLKVPAGPNTPTYDQIKLVLGGGLTPAHIEWMRLKANGRIVIDEGTGTVLNLGDGATTIGGLSIAGNDIANGTYDATALTGLGFGGTYGGTGTLTVVPEPAAPLLGAFGLLGLLRRRRA